MEQKPNEQEFIATPEYLLLADNLTSAVLNGVMSQQEAEDCLEAYLINYWGDDPALWHI